MEAIIRQPGCALIEGVRRRGGNILDSDDDFDLCVAGQGAPADVIDLIDCEDAASNVTQDAASNAMPTAAGGNTAQGAQHSHHSSDDAEPDVIVIRESISARCLPPEAVDVHTVKAEACMQPFNPSGPFWPVWIHVQAMGHVQKLRFRSQRCTTDQKHLEIGIEPGSHEHLVLRLRWLQCDGHQMQCGENGVFFVP